MTSAQASRVIAVLSAGFPAVTLELASTDLFLDALEELDDHELALEVAEKIVKTRPRFPALSELLDEYHGTRRRRNAAVEIPIHPAERDPEVGALLRGYVHTLKARLGEPTQLTLPKGTTGPCDDGCGHIGDRFRAGALQLCESCVLARARVARKLDLEPKRTAA